MFTSAPFFPNGVYFVEDIEMNLKMAKFLLYKHQ